jgi:hypothetical protein
MSRVLVLFSHPGALNETETFDWAQKEAADLAACAEVNGVSVTRLDAPYEGGAAMWQWMFEIHLAPEPSGELHRTLCRDLLLDLRLLGTRPVAVLVRDPEPV